MVRVLSVTGMTCAACSARVERRLARTPGVLRAGVDLLAETATVELSDDGSLEAALEAVRAAGYGASLPDPQADSRAREIEIGGARRQFLSAWGCLGAGALSMGAMALFPASHHGGTLAWTVFVAALLAAAVPGRRFFLLALSELRSRSLGMHVLSALGVTASLLLSLASLAAPAWMHAHEFPPGSYAESVLFLIGFLLLGRWLEARARARARDALEELARLQPDTAHRLEQSGEVDCPASLLRPGDLVRVRPGEIFPADGTVREGSGSADLSLVSGESLPERLEPGCAVTAGALNGAGALTVEVERSGEDSTLSRITSLVAEARTSKAQAQRLAERFVALFVPIVLVLAVAAALGWIFLPAVPRWNEAVFAVVAMLVAACPCALGLAVPAVVASASARAAREGLLVRDAAAFEALAKVNVVCLDKTGTLTQGRPDVVMIATAPGWETNRVLELAAGAESGSEHPLAGSVLRAAGKRGIVVPEFVNFAAVPGLGVEATVQGRNLRVGSPEWLRPQGGFPEALERLVAAARTCLVVEADGLVAGAIELRDALRPEAVAAVGQLRGAGIRTILITGDSQAAADEVAVACGFDEVHARVLPQGKLELVRALQAQGRTVAFVGDGLNDAPSLAAADVGLAIGTGTGAAIGSAPVTIVSGNPERIALAVRLGRRTRRFFVGNLVWAFGYNALLLPVAAGVLVPFGIRLSPGLAALAMSLSSVSVLANSLRLLRVRL